MTDKEIVLEAAATIAEGGETWANYGSCMVLRRLQRAFEGSNSLPIRYAEFYGFTFHTLVFSLDQYVLSSVTQETRDIRVLMLLLFAETL